MVFRPVVGSLVQRIAVQLSRRVADAQVGPANALELELCGVRFWKVPEIRGSFR